MKKIHYYDHVIKSDKFWLEKLSKIKPAATLLQFADKVLQTDLVLEKGTIQLENQVDICKIEEVMAKKRYSYSLFVLHARG